MTLNDILSGKKAARVFYNELRGMTVTEAANEPLKLREVASIGGRTVLPTGEPVTYATALCFVCLQTLVGKYTRKNKPIEAELAYMAKQMSSRYLDWSVLDLPTFVDMCVCSRIPSLRLGATEYELASLDIPSIMGKVESYDKMRPNTQALQGSSPDKAPAMQPAEKPLTTWHLTHKMGGAEYAWPDYESARRYWKHQPNFDDPQEMAFIKAAGGSQPILPSVNKVLGLQ